MASTQTIISDAQRYLHDASIGLDGSIWTRSELLDWLNDGYRQLIARSQAVRRLVAMPLPPRHTATYIHAWERRYVMNGTSRKITYTGFDGRRENTTLWEIEQRAGFTPQAHYTNITQLWEIPFVSTVDQHYRFALPKNHQSIEALFWDHKKLVPIITRELDYLDYAWYRQQGEPWHWTPGVGELQTVEIYEIDASYQQTYQIDNLYGIPRFFSGSRTWEASTLNTLQNGFAYTTDGDKQALEHPYTTFKAQSAYTSDGDVGRKGSAGVDASILNQAYLPTYQWTLHIGATSQGESWGTQPWEGDGSTVGAQRGQFPWASAHASYVPLASDGPVGSGQLKMPGLRITYDAINGYQAMQIWEKEMLQGETTFTAGGIIGTYAWEAAHGATNVAALPVGAMRLATSPDRQYWHSDTWKKPLGVMRDIQTSTNAMLLWEIVTPEVPMLYDNELSIPDMIPSELHKYLRYYIWSIAFARQGQGYNPNMAIHYQGRFERGIRVMMRYTDATWRDMRWQRQPVHRERSRVPMPRLPSDYPAVPWFG